MASCTRRGTPSSSVLASASDERALASPFPGPASEQLTPTPKLFCPDVEQKSINVAARDSMRRAKSLVRGVRGFGSGAKSFGVGAFCSGIGQKSINAATLQLHRRTRKPRAPSPELGRRSRKCRHRSSPAGECSQKHQQGFGAFAAGFPRMADAASRSRAPTWVAVLIAPPSARTVRSCRAAAAHGHSIGATAASCASGQRVERRAGSGYFLPCSQPGATSPSVRPEPVEGWTEGA